MSEPNATILDEQLFEQKSKDYYNLLVRLILRRTNNKQEAQDIAQTAFVRFLRLMKRKQWKLEIRYVQAYLNRIALNLCNDRWRQMGKERAVSYDDDKTREALDREAAQSDESVITMENRIYFKELYRTLPLNVILTGLSEYEEQVFLLRRLDGLSIKEIAPVVNREVCQVRYDLQKIEARIRYRVRKVIREDKSIQDSL